MKAVDLQLADKFLECKENFKKYENKGELLNPTISHVMGIVFGKLSEVQQGVHDEVVELTQNIEIKVLKPLNEYQVIIFNCCRFARKEAKKNYFGNNLKIIEGVGGGGKIVVIRNKLR